MNETISRRGDKILLGETELPAQDIIYVGVNYRAPRRFFVLCAVSAGAFALMGLTLAVVAFIAIEYGGASSDAFGTIIAVVFAAGCVTTCGSLALAMIRYPIEWLVEVAMAQQMYILNSFPSRMRANIYVNRVRRTLGI